MTLTESIQVASGVLVILGALVGSVWTLFRFVKLREAKKALQLTLHTKIYHLKESAVIEAKIELTNTGRVAILGKTPNNNGCQIALKAIPTNVTDAALCWEDERLVPLTEALPYLAEYDTPDPAGYIILEPGVPCEVFGYGVFSVKHKGLVMLRATFEDRDDFWWVTWKIVDTRPPGDQAYMKDDNAGHDVLLNHSLERTEDRRSAQGR